MVKGIKTKKNTCIIFFGLVLSFAMLVMGGSATYAGASIPGSDAKTKIINTAYMQGMYRCYTLTVGGPKKGKNDNGTKYSKITDKPQLDYEITSSGDHKSANYGSYLAMFPSPEAENRVALPNGWTGLPNNDSTLNCAKLAHGSSNVTSVYTVFGKSKDLPSASSDGTTKNAFFKKMGYSVSNEGTSNCFSIKLKYQIYKRGRKTDENGKELYGVGDYVLTPYDPAQIFEATSNTICFTPDDTGNAWKGGDDEIDYGDYSAGVSSFTNCDKYDVCIARTGQSDSDVETYQTAGKTVLGIHVSSNVISGGEYMRPDGYSQSATANDPNSSMNPTEKLIVVEPGMSFADIKTTLNNAISSMQYSDYDKNSLAGLYAKPSGSDEQYVVFFPNQEAGAYVQEEKGTAVGTNYTISDGTTAANTMLSYFIGSKNKNDLNLSDSQKVFTYQHYLKDLKTNGSPAATIDCASESAPSGAIEVQWFETTKERKTCYITINDSAMKLSTIDSDGWFSTSTKSLKEIVDELKDIKITTLQGITDEDLDNMSENPNEDLQKSDTSGTVAPDCYTNGGALAWVLCPIIDAGGSFVESAYEKYIEPFLILDSALFRNDSASNGTRQAWGNFQSIANLAFIVIFLVVIMSQITGYGIDNYGIKKILPKLIIAAILINLSYIICQVAVDVANIIGSGIKGMFEGIGKIDPSTSLIVAESPSVARAVGGTVIIVLLVGLISAPFVLSMGWAVLVPVFLAIISIVVAIVFLFILLGVRQALAVVLVVLSPMAFLCYMLPNTKKIYDRWFQMFKALLMAYPICALTVYGGQAVSRIMISASQTSGKVSFTMLLTAAVICIVPVYLIPSILKKSMGEVSNLVGKLQNLATSKSRDAAANTRGMRYLKRQGELYKGARQADFDSKMAHRALYGGKFQNKFANTVNRMTGRELIKPGLANKGTLKRSTQRYAYNAAINTAEAEDANQVKTYSSMFNALGGDGEVIDRLTHMKAKDLDENQIAAAISTMNDEDKVMDLVSKLDLNSIIGNDKDSVKKRQAIANALMGRKNNIIAQSAGKLIAKGGVDGGKYNISDLMKHNDLQQKVQSAGTSIMASQDKDVFATAGAANMFSAEQIAAGIGAGFTGTTAKNFNNMVSQSSVSSDAILNNMSMEQLANVSSSNYGATQSTLDLLGGAAGIEANSNAKAVLDTLKSSEGAQARSTMDANTMSLLGIEAAGPSVIASDLFIPSGTKHGTPVQLDIRNDGTAVRHDNGQEVDLKGYRRVAPKTK